MYSSHPGAGLNGKVVKGVEIGHILSFIWSPCPSNSGPPVMLTTDL